MSLLVNAKVCLLCAVFSLSWVMELEKLERRVVPESLEARDQRAVEHRDLAVQDQRGRDHGLDGRHDVREALGVVGNCPADQLHRGAVLVGQHPPTVHFLLADPAVAVEGLADQGALGDANGGITPTSIGRQPRPRRLAGVAID
jgi:hypothetical protein